MGGGTLVAGMRQPPHLAPHRGSRGRRGFTRCLRRRPRAHPGVLPGVLGAPVEEVPRLAAQIDKAHMYQTPSPRGRSHARMRHRALGLDPQEFVAAVVRQGRAATQNRRLRSRHSLASQRLATRSPGTQPPSLGRLKADGRAARTMYAMLKVCRGRLHRPLDANVLCGPCWTQAAGSSLARVWALAGMRHTRKAPW